MSDLLIPAWLWPEALEDWCGPVVVATDDVPYAVLHGGGLDGRYRVATADPQTVTMWAHPDNLSLDLARPEVQDRMARVVGPWAGRGHALDDRDERAWRHLGVLLHVEPDRAEQAHGVILHLGHLRYIARAVGLDPQPGERLEWEQATDHHGVIEGSWHIRVIKETQRRWEWVNTEYEGYDPHEAARIVAKYLKENNV